MCGSQAPSHELVHFEQRPSSFVPGIQEGCGRSLGYLVEPILPGILSIYLHRPIVWSFTFENLGNMFFHQLFLAKWLQIALHPPNGQRKELIDHGLGLHHLRWGSIASV